LEQFEEQWLEEVIVENPSTTVLGHRFAERMLRDWHEIDSASAEMILCDGAGDGGIDAAIFIREDLDEGIEGDNWNRRYHLSGRLTTKKCAGEGRPVCAASAWPRLGRRASWCTNLRFGNAATRRSFPPIAST
jgi:hypothetical protein